MKLVALLAWYEESPSWLSATVASLVKAQVTHVVAVDGAYKLFPNALQQPCSGPEQAEAIVETARACGMGVTVHQPAGPWMGNEVEKRDFMFQAGRLVAAPNDWFLCIDADEIVTHAPPDLLDRLEAAEEDVAGLTLYERHPQQPVPELAPPPNPMPMLEQALWVRAVHRAAPDLRVEHAHYLYLTGPTDKPRVMRGRNLHELEPALELVDLRVEHRNAFRPRDRNQAGQEYDLIRDRYQAEQVPALAAV